jgi:hypothetical protein
MTLALIPKGILNKGQKKCFSFIWTGKREKEGISLIKEAAGWGLKNIHIFSSALAAKVYGG